MATVTKTSQVALRVPDDLIEKLEKRAAAAERTLSAEVRLAIKAYLKAAA